MYAGTRASSPRSNCHSASREVKSYLNNIAKCELDVLSCVVFPVDENVVSTPIRDRFVVSADELIEKEISHVNLDWNSSQQRKLDTPPTSSSPSMSESN